MRRLLSVLTLSLAITLAPGLALARVGSGASFGSRGLRTYAAPPSTSVSPFASPIRRSLTAPSPGFASPSFASPGVAPSYGYGRRSGFGSGLLGGVLGVGLGSLLFGGGLHGGGSLIGLLIQLALLYFVGRWLYRRFVVSGAGAGPAFAAPGINRFTTGGTGGYAGAASPRSTSLALTRQDYDAFSSLLQEMQAAWSRADLPRLQRLATPEMVSYFAEQLAEQASQGVRNTVTDIRLEKGELSEAWSEAHRDYATVAMRFSAIDVTRDRSGRVIDGSDAEHVTTSELWTFVRARGGGNWLLSAIQQLR